MRKGERPFSTTWYARLPEVRAARYMVTRGYCQVSRRFGWVSRVDVSDDELLARIGRYVGRSASDPWRCTAESWYDFYRRCVSEDVVTDVPEPVMCMIRNPGMKYKPPEPLGTSDEEFVTMILELGLVK